MDTPPHRVPIITTVKLNRRKYRSRASTFLQADLAECDRMASLQVAAEEAGREPAPADNEAMLANALRKMDGLIGDYRCTELQQGLGACWSISLLPASAVLFFCMYS